jgi:hypothetical protein
MLRILRSIANVVFVLCLTAWIGLVLVMSLAIAQNGFGGIWPKLLHVAGAANPLDKSSGRQVILTLLELLLVTLLAAYARRLRHSKRGFPGSPRRV